MFGPFTTASRLTPIHQMSLAVLSRAACASMSTTTPTTTTTRDRVDRYGPTEWVQLVSHHRCFLSSEYRSVPLLLCNNKLRKHLDSILYYMNDRMSRSDACYCHIRHNLISARLPVLQVGGQSSMSNGCDTKRRAAPCAVFTHRGAGWAWRDMQMDVSCSWDCGRPGIG